MCRRTLAESSNSAQANATQQPPVNPQDAEILSQVATFMEQLHTNGAVPYVDMESGDFVGFGQRLYVPAGGFNEDDRSEFSGMYS